MASSSSSSSRLHAVLQAGRAHRANQKTNTGTWYQAHHAELNDERDEELDRLRNRMEDIRFEQSHLLGRLRVSTAESQAPNACMTVILRRLMRTPSIAPGRYRLTNDLIRYLADSDSHIKNYHLDLSIPSDPHLEVDEFADIREWERHQRERGLMPEEEEGDLYS